MHVEVKRLETSACQREIPKKMALKSEPDELECELNTGGAKRQLYPGRKRETTKDGRRRKSKKEEEEGHMLCARVAILYVTKLCVCV